MFRWPTIDEWIDKLKRDPAAIVLGFAAGAACAYVIASTHFSSLIAEADLVERHQAELKNEFAQCMRQSDACRVQNNSLDQELKDAQAKIAALTVKESQLRANIQKTAKFTPKNRQSWTPVVQFNDNDAAALTELDKDILVFLFDKPRSLDEISKRFDLSSGVTQYHLWRLVDGRLIFQPDLSSIYFRVSKEGINYVVEHKLQN